MRTFAEIGGASRPYLNANEIDADPEMLSNPDAKQKQRNRSGQVAGASKLHIPGQFSWSLIEMQESFAYRVLSLSARRVMDRLEIELAKHGGKSEANGELVCRYSDFEAYGVADRHAIAPAIRELVALGFVRVTRRGAAGNADYRRAAMYRLTYRHSGSNRAIEDGWRRILSLEEAETLARAARAEEADARAREFGRRGGRAAAAKKQKSGGGSHTEPGGETRLKPGGGNHTEGDKIPVGETPPLSRVSHLLASAAPHPAFDLIDAGYVIAGRHVEFRKPIAAVGLTAGLLAKQLATSHPWALGPSWPDDCSGRAHHTRAS
jgi:hypothetical protein